jgi:hypothetical protein
MLIALLVPVFLKPILPTSEQRRTHTNTSSVQGDDAVRALHINEPPNTTRIQELHIQDIRANELHDDKVQIQIQAYVL